MQELARALNGAVEKRRAAATARTASTALPPRALARLALTLAFVAGVALTAGAWSWRQRQAQPVRDDGAGGGGRDRARRHRAARRAASSVDGKPVAETTPTALHGVAAGEHVVRVDRPRRAPVEQHVELGDGERALVQLALPPASHRAAPRDGARRAPSSTSTASCRSARRRSISPSTDDEFYQLAVEKDGFEMTHALAHARRSRSDGDA